MGGRRGGSAGRRAVVRRRRRGHVDGRAGLGLGCSRLLFNPCEVDAATLRERKKQDGFHLVFSGGVQTVTLTRRLFVHSHNDFGCLMQNAVYLFLLKCPWPSILWYNSNKLGTAMNSFAHQTIKRH